MGVFDHDASKSLIARSDNLIQLCLHVGNWFGRDVYHNGFCSTTSGRAEHSDLANGILGLREMVGCPLLNALKPLPSSSFFRVASGPSASPLP